MNEKKKGLFALLGTVFIWSFMTIIVRSVVVDSSSVTLLFIRLFVAEVFFLPFFILSKVWRKPNFSKLALISLLSTGNIFGFMMGIKYTSASVSQLIYSLIPLIILTFSYFYLKKNFSLSKIAGILAGFAGLLYIFYSSILEKGVTITGGIVGNIIIIFAAFNWAGYIVFSKKMSKFFSPLEIGSVSVTVSFLAAIVFFAINLLFSGERISITFPLLGGGFFAGFFGTFLTYILFQYALSRLSPLTVSFATYIQPVTTSVLAILLIGEKLTASFLVGSLLVLFGVFLSNTYDLLKSN